MGQPLVFLSSAEGVNGFSKLLRDDPVFFSKYTCLSLSPKAGILLSRQGISFTDTLPFFTNDSHRRVLLKSEELIKLLESFLDTGDPVFLYFLSSFRLITNYMLWLSEVIVNAVDELKPSHIFIDQKGELLLDPSSSQVSLHDGYAGHLIKFRAKKDGIPFDSITFSDPARGKVKGRSKRNLHFSVISGIVKRKVRKHLSPLPVIVFTSRGYNLLNRIPREIDGISDHKCLVLDFSPVSGIRTYIKMVINVLLGRKEYSLKTADIPEIPIALFPGNRARTHQRRASVQRMLTAVSEKIDQQWKVAFDYRGMDVAHCLSRKILSGMIPDLMQWVRLEGQLHEAMGMLDAKAVFTPFSTGIYGVIGDWCLRNSVPGFMVHHGALAPPKTSLEEIAWRRLSQGQMLSPYPYVLAQTPRASAHAAYFGIQNRKFNTGPILFARVKHEKGDGLRRTLNISPDDMVVVYAVAQRQRTSMRFQIFETEDETISTMKDVIGAVRKLDGVHLILKLHPAYRYSPDSMKILFPQCDRVHYLRHEPFEDVLSASDLLISSLSTTIEEALINQVPVILYDKWKRYNYLDATDCSEMGEREWPLREALYTSRKDQLHLIISHMLFHRKEIRSDTRQFEAHLFSADQMDSVSDILKKFVSDSSL